MMWVKRDSKLPHWVARERAAKKRTAAAKTHCATLKRLRRVAAKYLSVDLCVTPCGRLRRKSRQCVQTPRPAEIASASIAGEQIVESRGQGRSVSGLDQESGLLVLNHIAEAAGVERDDRRFAKKRLDGDESQPFIHGWQHDCRRALVERRELGLAQLSVPAHA